MRAFTVIVLVGILAGILAATGFCPAAPPKPKVASRQYKRVHQAALTQILGGNAAGAVKQLKNYLAKDAGDAESYYMLAQAYVRQADPEAALDALRRAIRLGLPPGRFVSGADSPFAALRNKNRYQQLLDLYGHRIVHGPLLGCVTGRSVKIWLRTAQPAEVRVSYEKVDKNPAAAGETSPVLTRKETDHTAVLSVDELQPQTTYRYWVTVNGQRAHVEPFRFRTAAVKGVGSKFKIAFGGGAGYVPPNERVWDTIAEQKPDVLLLLGDNVYSDDPKTPQMQRYCYYRRQSRPEFQRLTANTPVYSIWDDHDFGTNDCWGGPDIDDPKWKRPVWNIFRNNWNNPAYGGGKQQPGCWYDFYIGDVHFIMLDGRYYRTNPKSDAPSMLGPAQKKWLLQTVNKSTATFKVHASPVPWTFNAKGDSRDTWNGYRAERKEIFDFLTKNEIGGVILISADRHRSDLWKIDRPNDYALYEMNSSRLTNQHVHPTMEKALFSYNEKQSFGIVQFDTTADDPTVTYRIITIDGEQVHAFSLNLSKL